MKILEGLNIYLGIEFNDDECLLCDKAIYGLIQVRREFHRGLSQAMENEMGFEKCLADECLLKRRIEKGSIVVCVYIDDTLCVGNKEAIN